MKELQKFSNIDSFYLFLLGYIDILKCTLLDSEMYIFWWELTKLFNLEWISWVETK